MSAVGIRLAVAALLLLALSAASLKCYVEGRRAGMAEVQARWDGQVAAIEKSVNERARANQTVITKVVTRVVQKAAEERVVYRDLIKEVENYVPSTLPALPADFRVYHDAAAAGVPVPEVGDPARADAAPVRPEDLAVTVAENYAGCREDRRRLEALQQLLRQVGAL